MSRSRARFVAIVVVLTLAATMAAGAAAQAPAIGVAVQEPRAYGHVVGDRINRRLRFELPAGYRLERASLPEQGKQSYWLDLASVSVDAEAERGGRVTVRLDYQLFYAPLQASRRELPGFSVRAVSAAGERLEARVPGFAFTMSPIIALQPEAEFGNAENNLMLGDERPALRAVARHRNAALVAALAALAALAIWAWATDRLPGRKRGPFAQAAARLKALRRAEPDAALPQALRALHRAFDATAGRALFAEDVDGFLERHPVFADLRTSIVAFFDCSRRFFFAGDAGRPGGERALAELERLARACRQRERRA